MSWHFLDLYTKLIFQHSFSKILQNYQICYDAYGSYGIYLKLLNYLQLTSMPDCFCAMSAVSLQDNIGCLGGFIIHHFPM